MTAVIARGYSAVSPVNTKLKNVNRVQRVYQYLGMRPNLTEIALIAGVSERFMYNPDIKAYWSDTTPVSDDDIEFVVTRFIKQSISNADSTEEVLGAILGIYLKIETDVFDKVEGFKELAKLGTYIVKLYKLCSYKDDGVPIHSQNQIVKCITNSRIKDKVDYLFTRSKTYRTDAYSKRWQPTELLSEYVRISIYKFFALISEPSLYNLFQPPSHMLPKKAANSNIYYIYINIDVIKDFGINSIFYLLMSTVEIKENRLKVAIQNESSTDESLGRTYNVFSRIRSKERLQLGYISYDMNAALQSISLQLIKALPEDFPMLWAYTHDKDFKRQIRIEIANDLNITIDEVKAKLTAFANGGIDGKNKHKHFNAFFEESDRLRREVLKYVSEHEPDVLNRAIEQSKKDLPDGIDWNDIESKEKVKDMRDKSSAFFFVWTWYERKIRQAMLTVLTDGIELHDAVYSKMNVEASLLEEAILKLTGFKVVIDVEHLGS